MKIVFIYPIFIASVCVSVLHAQQVQGVTGGSSVNASVRNVNVSADIHATSTAPEGWSGGGFPAKSTIVKNVPGANRLRELFAGNSISVQAGTSGVTEVNAVSLSGPVVHPYAQGSATSSSFFPGGKSEAESRGASYPRLGQFPDSTRGTALLSPRLYTNADIFEFRPSDLGWTPRFGAHPLLNPSYAAAVPLFLMTRKGLTNRPLSLEANGIQSPEQKLNGLSNPLNGSGLSDSLTTRVDDWSIDDQSK